MTVKSHAVLCVEVSADVVTIDPVSDTRRPSGGGKGVTAGGPRIVAGDTSTGGGSHRLRMLHAITGEHPGGGVDRRRLPDDFCDDVMAPDRRKADGLDPDEIRDAGVGCAHDWRNR